MPFFWQRQKRRYAPILRQNQEKLRACETSAISLYFVEKLKKRIRH
jgi:hypothetical protein